MIAPKLNQLIYHLENQSAENYAFSLKDGKFTNFKQEDELGPQFVPLAPWTAEQGYHLMQDFMHSLGASMDQFEVANILLSRRHVFKKFREYIHQKPVLHSKWMLFKQKYMLRYLAAWYEKQDPKHADFAKYLRSELSKLANETMQSTVETEGELHSEGLSSLSNVELEEAALSEGEGEDWELSLDLLREDLPIYRMDEPAAALKKYNEPSSLDLNTLEQSVTLYYWLILLPSGDEIARLCYSLRQPSRYHSPKAEALEPELCIEYTRQHAEYAQLNLSAYLLHEFLSSVSGKTDCQNIRILMQKRELDHAISEILAGAQASEAGKIYFLS